TGDPPGVTSLPVGERADRLAESTVAVRVAAVLSFYRYHGEVHGVPVAGRLYRAGRRSSRYLPGLTHLARGAGQARPAVRVPRQDHPAGARVKSGRYRRIYVSDALERLHSEYVWQLCDADAHRALDLENHFVFVNLHRGRWLAPLRPETVYDRVAALKRRLG